MSAIPEQSPEIVAVVKRILHAWAEGDESALTNLYSGSPWFRAIGTDEAEWWDVEVFGRVFAAQLEEIPTFEVSWGDVEAFEFGQFGWGAANCVWEFVGGPSVPARITAVFMIEEGVWRCVQWHVSIPVPNEEAIGVSITRTLDELLESLDSESLKPIEGTEGTASIMFTDIEDSTPLAQEMGDRAWTELIEGHHRLLESAVARHDGTLIKMLGDGALVAFGGTRAALRCAIEIQQGVSGERFAVKIGVHAGEVVHAADDVLGTTVNKAARVAAAATGGQIVVSSVVRELAGATDEFLFGDPFVVELKGMEGVHELHPLDWQVDGSSKEHDA